MAVDCRHQAKGGNFKNLYGAIITPQQQQLHLLFLHPDNQEHNQVLVPLYYYYLLIYRVMVHYGRLSRHCLDKI